MEEMKTMNGFITCCLVIIKTSLPDSTAERIPEEKFFVVYRKFFSKSMIWTKLLSLLKYLPNPKSMFSLFSLLSSPA